MDDIEELWNNISQQIISDMEAVCKRVEELFKQAIDETIINVYSPNTYVRTYMFRESVKAHYDKNNDVIYVYSDINSGYYSAVDGRDVTPAISYWLEHGHEDDTGIDNAYHNYGERRYLERAEELIKKEYPDLDIEIIDEPPSKV